MHRFRLLEILSTKLFLLTAVFVLVAVPSVFAYLLKSGLADLNTLTNFVDATFKAVALIVGAIWALNRYYTTRTDVSQLRVDSDITCIPAARFGNMAANYSLLIYRLDIVNTGKTLIGRFGEYVEIQAVNPTSSTVDYVLVGRWPSDGLHPGGPIEPGSWSAINDTISIPAKLQAVRIFVGLDLGDDGAWTWHKTFDISHQQAME